MVTVGAGTTGAAPRATATAPADLHATVMLYWSAVEPGCAGRLAYQLPSGARAARTAGSAPAGPTTVTVTAEPLEAVPARWPWVGRQTRLMHCTGLQ